MRLAVHFLLLGAILSTTTVALQFKQEKRSLLQSRLHALEHDSIEKKGKSSAKKLIKKVNKTSKKLKKLVKFATKVTSEAPTAKATKKPTASTAAEGTKKPTAAAIVASSVASSTGTSLTPAAATLEGATAAQDRAARTALLNKTLQATKSIFTSKVNQMIPMSDSVHEEIVAALGAAKVTPPLVGMRDTVAEIMDMLGTVTVNVAGDAGTDSLAKLNALRAPNSSMVGTAILRIRNVFNSSLTDTIAALASVSAKGGEHRQAVAQLEDGISTAVICLNSAKKVLDATLPLATPEALGEKIARIKAAVVSVSQTMEAVMQEWQASATEKEDS